MPNSDRCHRRRVFRAVTGAHRFWFTAGLLNCVSLAATSACGPESTAEISTDCQSLDPVQEFTVTSWWEPPPPQGKQCAERGAEACATQALVDNYAACTGGQLRFEDGRTKSQTIPKLMRLNRDSVPERTAGAIVNGGVDVWRLARTEDIQSLSSSGAPYPAFLVERTPDFLRPLVTWNGSQYGAIIGLHRLNQLFYNRAVLDREDIAAALASRGLHTADVGSWNLDAFETVLSVLAEHNYSKPLWLADDPEALSTFVIENIMVALSQENEVNPEGYTQFWEGLEGSSGPGTVQVNTSLFDQALERVETLARYIELKEWVKGQTIVGQVDEARDRAVFTVTGDWEMASMPPDMHVGAFPGTGDAYVYTVDVAVLMQSQELLMDATPATAWLKVMTSARTQADLFRTKHSLPTTTVRDGVTVARTSEEMFFIDGKRLDRIAGLPTRVPHGSFDELGKKIRDYVECVGGDASSDAASNQPDCGKQSLVDYVYDEYCSVVSEQGATCERVERVEPGPHK